MNAKKIISLALALLILLPVCITGITAADAELPFTDVKKNWAYEPIKYVYETGLMNGTGDGTKFSPNMNLSRGMVVTVLYRNDGSPEGKYQNPFCDLPEGKYYTTAAMWAYTNGIVTGTGENEWGEPYFSADRNITRQELAAMFARYASYKHVDTSKNTVDINGFPDVSNVAKWATDAVKWTVGTGIITGKSNDGKTTLSPKDEATRAEYATIIKRYNDKDAAREFSYLLYYASPTPVSTYTERDYPLVEDADIYVAVDGNDKNAGTKSSPLATLEGAKARVRELKKTRTEGEIKVAFMAGTYAAPEELEFTSEDGGNDKLKITYCAYGDGEVQFSGGVTVSGKDFTVLTDAEREMFPEATRDKVRKSDLSKYGIDVASITEDNAVFAGKERMDLARWPNKTDKGNDALTDKNLVASVNSGAGTLVFRPTLTERLNKYHNIENMYMLGYYMYDWSYSKGKIIDYDAETGTIKPTINGYGLGTSSEFNIPCFYFYNIPDELDRADEYYIDKKTGYLYVTDTSVDYTIAQAGQMITMTDTDYVSFVALTFCYGADNGVYATDSDHVTFDRCYFRNIRGKGIYITGNNVTVTSCEFYDVGARNVELISGDRETLTLGNSVIENCLFDKFGSVDKTGNSAIHVWGCGIRIAHNEICNSSNMGISYSEYIWASNYITIEYNYLHNVVTQTSDSGAIYGGRNLAGHGTVVRYNLISDIGDSEEGYHPLAIYLDDYMSGQEVYGNIIYSEGCDTIFMHGGRENKIHDNIFIALGGDKWSSAIKLNSEDHDKTKDNTENFTKPIGDHEHLMILELVPFRTGIWAERFPTLAKCLYEKDVPVASYADDIDFIINSSYNEVYGNHIFANAETFKSEYLEYYSENVLKYATKIEASAQYSLEENPYFTDPTHGDYTIKTGSDILDIQFEKIGRY